MTETRIAQYGLIGGLSMVAHLIVLLILVEIGRLDPVLSTTLGFIVSVFVSLLLQHYWLFHSTAGWRLTAPRFVAVTLFGLLLNTSIMSLGYRLVGVHYLLVQIPAFAAVPLSNYLLNSAWTFRARNTIEARSWCSHALYLVLPFAALSLIASFSVLSLDRARDFSIALDIAQGLALPLHGPPLAGVIHLGPVWFWFLGWLQLLGLNLSQTVILVALLGTLKFWFVVMIAQKLDCIRFGYLWIAILCLPTWTTFEFVFVSHPVLEAACLTALILFGLRFAEAGRWTDAAAIGLSYSLALHAHPSSLAMVALPAGFAWFAWRNGRLTPSAMLASAVAFVFPFLPWLIYEAGAGFPTLEGLAQYAARQRNAVDLTVLPDVIWAVIGGGTLYWVREMLLWPPALGWLFVITLITLSLYGLVHTSRLAVAGNRFARLLLLTFLSGTGILVLIRSVHPYYMLSGLHLVWGGIVALGLSRSSLATLRWFVVSVSYAVLTMSAIQVMNFQRRGELPFAAYPLFNVTAKHGETRPQPFLPVNASADSGRWLCENGDGAVVHGSYGLSLLHSFSIESRYQCAQTTVRVAGGPLRARHYLGLSRAVLAQADIEPIETVGGFGIIPALPTEKPTPTLIPAERRYPPVEASWGRPRTARIPLDTDAGIFVATNYGFMMSYRPKVRALCGSDELAPIAGDNVTWVFDPAECEELFVLEIVAPNPEYIGLAVVPANT